MAEYRKFETGADRTVDTDKFDYEGFLSPLVLERFGRYMHKHRFRDNGDVRESDNWQKGILKDSYIKSLLRHVIDVWSYHRTGCTLTGDDVEESLSAVMFNSMGYLFEQLRNKQNAKP